MNLEDSIAHWRMLATEQRQRAARRPDLYPAAPNKAALYERTATSLELELETGIPHCVCCLKPRDTKGTQP